MTDDVTPDEADEEMAKLGPDDISAMEAEDAKGELSPVWQAALDRFLRTHRGYGQRSGSHRRGRRG
jgi:hypothetical protein